MRKRFRFASLLQWRQRERDEAGAAVGQALQAIGRVDEQLNELNQTRDRVRTQSSQQLVGTLSVDRLLADGRYSMQIEMDLRGLAETRGKLVEALEQRQQRLVQAEAEVKRFEKLAQKQHTEQQQEQLRREQAAIDEAVSNRYLMLNRHHKRHEQAE